MPSIRRALAFSVSAAMVCSENLDHELENLQLDEILEPVSHHKDFSSGVCSAKGGHVCAANTDSRLEQSFLQVKQKNS